MPPATIIALITQRSGFQIPPPQPTFLANSVSVKLAVVVYVADRSLSVAYVPWCVAPGSVTLTWSPRFRSLDEQIQAEPGQVRQADSYSSCTSDALSTASLHHAPPAVTRAQVPGCSWESSICAPTPRHIAAPHEGLVVGRLVRNAVPCLVLGMNLRLHPRSVARLDCPEKIPKRPHPRRAFMQQRTGTASCNRVRTGRGA